MNAELGTCGVCNEAPAVRRCPDCGHAMCADCDDGEPCGVDLATEEDAIRPANEFEDDGFEEYDAAQRAASPRPARAGHPSPKGEGTSTEGDY